MIHDVTVDERNLVSQGPMLLSVPGAPAMIYRRGHDSVTALYSADHYGQRTGWPIYADERTGERYFAVIVVPETVTDIVAEALGATASKVLNGGDVRVSAETAARIVAAAERLGYCG